MGYKGEGKESCAIEGPTKRQVYDHFNRLRERGPRLRQGLSEFGDSSFKLSNFSKDQDRNIPFSSRLFPIQVGRGKWSLSFHMFAGFGLCYLS